jgi:twitching motility protein PilT
MQLSNALEAVISQRLIPAVSGGRAVATELLVATAAVKSIVRDGKSHLIDNVIQTSADMGMMTMDMSLASLVAKGKISFDTASAYAVNPQYLKELVKKG